MTKIISRHIFSHVFLAVITLTAVLVFGAWLTQSLRFIEIIIEKNASIFKFFSLIYLLLPSLTAIVLPICAMLSSVYVLNRFITDNEIVVCKSCGYSNWQIASPVLFCGIVVAFFCAFLNHYLAPKSSDQFQVMRGEVGREFSSTFVREGVFNQFKDTVIFVSKYGQNDLLEGIYIQEEGKRESEMDNSDDDDLTKDDYLTKEEKEQLKKEKAKTEVQFIIFAQSGYLVSQDNKNILYLYNGCRQEIDALKNKHNIAYFDELKYDLDLRDDVYKKRKKQNRLSFWEMINPPSTYKKNTVIKLFIEVNKRIINPLFVVCFSLFACAVLLSGQGQRRGRWKKPVFVVAVSLVFQLSILTLLNSYGKNPYAILMCYIIMFLFIVINLIAIIKPELTMCVFKQVTTLLGGKLKKNV